MAGYDRFPAARGTDEASSGVMTNQAHFGDECRRPASRILPGFIFSIAAFSAGACAVEDEPAAPTPESGGSAGTGGSGGVPGGGSGGSSNAAVVGSFVLSVTPGAGTVADKVSVLGKVYDAENPSNVVWLDGLSAGGCVLRTPKVPFCDPECGDDVCVADGVCKAHATAVNVGKVRVRNVSTVDGSLDFELTQVAFSYQVPGAVKLAYPPFAESDTVRFEADGGSGSPFTLEAPALAPTALTGDTPKLDRGQPFSVTWTPPSDPSRSVMRVLLNISHHGGTSGKIDCELPDSGSLTIPANLITALVDVGVSGFPTVKLTRHTSGTTRTTWGVVSLDVESEYERSIEITGIESCNLPEDCASGVCRDDRTCG